MHGAATAGRVGSRNVSTAGVEAPLVCKWHGKLL